ncbi:MAG: glucosaminidase domain-containing protein [Bacteroidales bacterium]|nr:glucosaminidase domain-containing protein [Bacteroidales bacterium]
MKRTLCIIAALLSGLLALTGEDLRTPQEKYIDKYGPLAVEEMYRSGIPASITLAQGLLESGSGLSTLATQGNNHFGIKCHNNWKGRTMRLDDDKKAECFRVYDDPRDSYRDHSDFLRFRPRYQSLFELEITDYKAWANGLLKAGYATDKAYAAKLIRIVEEYDLSRFDHEPLSERRPGTLPQTPASLSESRPLDERASESFHFSFSRPVYELNGVPFVYSASGDTYASIAETNGLYTDELLRYNDLRTASDLLPGTVVYLRAKKSKAVKGMYKYIVEQEGESLRDVAQMFAVKESSLRRMNSFKGEVTLHEGDTVILRKR